MHDTPDPYAVDRTAFSIVSLETADAEDRTYWHAKTPEERLAALELMRQVIYGYNPATARMHRVLEIVAVDATFSH